MKNRIASRRPEPDETTSEYHQQLIDGVAGDCVMKASWNQLHWLCELASSISTEQVDRIHAPYGWTIRQVIEHCADAERVFGYRILRFAAGDETPVPGWDENAYADSRFGLGNFTHLVTELGDLRKANLMLLRRIAPAAWEHRGTADDQQLTTRALAWIAAGHLQHHLAIIEKRCNISVARQPE